MTGQPERNAEHKTHHSTQGQNVDWNQAKEERTNVYEIPARWVGIDHYEALNIMFRVENALRIFVYCILKREYGSRWQGLEISTAEISKIAISKLVSRRLEQQEDFKYLTAPVACPMMYLNSGELIHLIFSDSYWSKFARYMRGRKEVLKIKLDEIGLIRNALAHFRPITSDNVAVLKQNAKHVFGGIEYFLNQICSCHRVVPTNTDAEWYRALSVLGNDLCNLALYESQNREWVRMQLDYKTPMINSQIWASNAASFEFINLRSPAILDFYPAIAEKVINITEIMPMPTMPADFNPSYLKQISFVFSADFVQESYAEIHQAFAALLTAIAEERELLAADHLARGRLLEAAPVYAYVRREGDNVRWIMNEDSLLSPVPENAPPEYWQTIGRFDAGFLDSAQRYPWMPVDISRADFPF